MNLQEFLASLDQKNPPEQLSEHLKSLWYDAKGDWDQAHHIADRVLSDRDGDWIHAYLHRKEGDQYNASYWYNRAAKPKHKGTLQQEWQELVEHFIG